jgi:hypothetical protein
MKQLVALTYDPIFILFTSHMSFNPSFFMSFWLVAKGGDQPSNIPKCLKIYVKNICHGTSEWNGL